MSPQTTHPLVDAYLRDLEVLLQGVEPSERAEVLAGVWEHLDGRLGPDAADATVRQALDELGPPQDIADEAYAGRQAPPPRRPGVLSRRWVPVTVGILLAFALCGIVLVAGSLGGYSTSTSVSGDAAGTLVTDEQVQFAGAGPSGAIMALVFTWLLWLPATILTLASPLWSARQKGLLCLLAPAAAAVLTLFPAIGWALSDRELGINAGAWTSLALVLIGGGWLLTHLCRAAARASTT